MRLLHVVVLLALLLPAGCGGGGGGGATAPDDFSIPASLSLTSDNLTLVTGTATQVTTTGHYTDRADQDLTASVTLSSSNDAVAVPVFGTATIMALSPGTAVITATWQNSAGDTVMGNMTLTVVDATATAVNVAPATASIPEGASQSFTVSVTFNNGITQELPNTLVAWSSSDTLIATVDASGVATGVGAGSATISATFDGVKGDATLTVEAVLESISMSASPDHINVDTGDSTQMTVTGLYSDGATVNLTEQAFYVASTSIQGVVVSNQEGSRGLVTGVSAVGTVTITASYGDLVATKDIAVISGSL